MLLKRALLQELEITTALLDNVDDKCTPQHIVRVEVKSLRDTRQLIEKVGLKEAENFIKDNPHPQLWYVWYLSIALIYSFVKMPFHL